MLLDQDTFLPDMQDARCKVAEFKNERIKHKPHSTTKITSQGTKDHTEELTQKVRKRDTQPPLGRWEQRSHRRVEDVTN
jgi:hypothetical protein